MSRKHKHKWRKVGGVFKNGKVVSTKKRCILCGETKEILKVGS